jgi:hypothetical protein
MRTATKLSVFFCLIGSWGVCAAQTPDVSGTWVEDSHAKKWVIDQKDSAIHIQEFDGNRVEADFSCALNGKQCDVKEDGHAEKIMVYFNGAKLVEIRERGSNTVKQRLSVSPDGKTLTVETVPLSASQKAETLSFRRQQT